MRSSSVICDVEAPSSLPSMPKVSGSCCSDFDRGLHSTLVDTIWSMYFFASLEMLLVAPKPRRMEFNGAAKPPSMLSVPAAACIWARCNITEYALRPVTVSERFVGTIARAMTDLCSMPCTTSICFTIAAPLIRPF